MAVRANLDWTVSCVLNTNSTCSATCIDFDWGLRERDDLKTLVYENIQDLKRRGVVDWLDIDGIWSRHQRKQANHANALTLLASLEINLKVKEKQA